MTKERIEGVVDMRDADVHPAERRVVIVGNCKDCKHWDPANAPYTSYATGYCGRIVTYSGSGDVTSEAAWIDAPGGGDGLQTLPGFGCVLFEAKEEG